MMLTAEDAYWHACANVPVPEPDPVVFDIVPVRYLGENIEAIVIFDNGQRVRVYRDEIAHGRESRNGVARVVAIAEERRAAGNVLRDDEFRWARAEQRAERR